MWRTILTTTLLAGAVLPARPAVAQVTDAEAMQAFAPLLNAIVRIRTVADLEYSPADRKVGSEQPDSRPYSVDGTGVVVGTTLVNGRTEYLILTNHHVADASNYVMDDGGYLRVNPKNTQAVPRVAEESFLMAEQRDSILADDVRLVEVVRRVEGDMTLMRTDGATRALTVFEGDIGYVGDEIDPGAVVLTSGYPWGGKQIAAVGSVLEVDYPHELGMPHEDFVVDLPVEPGQSGGPIFLVEGGRAAGDPVTFRLIGLIHAKDRERNYGVPYELWHEVLPEFPRELEGRLVGAPAQGETSASANRLVVR